MLNNVKLFNADFHLKLPFSNITLNHSINMVRTRKIIKRKFGKFTITDSFANITPLTVSLIDI